MKRCCFFKLEGQQKKEIKIYQSDLDTHTQITTVQTFFRLTWKFSDSEFVSFPFLVNDSYEMNLHSQMESNAKSTLALERSIFPFIIHLQL